MSDVLDDAVIMSNDDEHVDFETKADKLIEEGYEFKTQEYIKEAWNFYWSKPGPFIGYFFVYLAISVLASLIPVIGSFAQSILSPALSAGFIIVAKKMYKGEAYEFGNFFDGFKKFGPLLGASILSGLIILGMMLLLVIPGIYFAVGYMFLTPIILFTDVDVLMALKKGRLIITKQWWSFFGFVILLGLINIVGLLCLGIGIIFTSVISQIAIYIAYEKIVGTNKDE